MREGSFDKRRRTWMILANYKLGAGKSVTKKLPNHYLARWIRFTADKDTRATTWLEYKGPRGCPKDALWRSLPNAWALSLPQGSSGNLRRYTDLRQYSCLTTNGTKGH